ncbi:MAG: M48 family metalloprotease [Bacteroidales bacterium]|nr:M48 family metalloprotease [Bacteroidales bacterium]
MNFVENMVNQDIFYALGWTLIHSIWQIAIIGLLLKLSLFLFKSKSPELRYWVSISAIILVVIISVKTFTNYFPDNSINGNSAVSSELISLSGSSNEAFSNNYDAYEVRENLFFQNLTLWIGQNIIYIVGIWMLGIILFSIRLAGSFLFVQRIKNRTNFPMEKKWNEYLISIKQKLNIFRRVQLMESVITNIPMVIGHFKPVILLPLGLISSLPCEQVEAIITHELAHIKRKDFLLNIFKSMLEVVFFYHPVFWWISSMADDERENCCDDLTLSVCNETDSLQKALLNLQNLNNNTNKLAAALYQNNYQLLKRIKRMKTKNLPKGCLRQNNHGFKGILAVLFILAAGIIVFMGTSAFSPKHSDIPNNDQIFGIIAPTVTEITREPVDKHTPETVIEIVPENVIPNPSLVEQKPDTVKKESSSGNVQLEIDENGNLIKVTKNGEELKEEEKEKYEKMVSGIKAMKEEEYELQKVQEELEKTKEVLKAAQEEMDKAAEEYNTALDMYYQKLSSTMDNSAFEAWSHASGDYAKALILSKIAEEKYNDIMWNFSEVWENVEKNELLESLEDIEFDEQFDLSQDLYEDVLKLQEMEMDLIADKINLQIEELQDIKLFDLEMEVFESRIRSELVEDKLLKDEDDKLSFRISSKKLAVNGKKQSKELHEKYLRLCEDLFDEKFNDDREIIIED